MLPLHNVTFFHNYCTIDSTTMSTAYPQHIHIVLFATTLQSTLALLFIYAFLFTMWYFSTMTVQFTLQQYFQHFLNIYIRYCLQLHYPVYWLCFYICFLFTMWYFFTITAQLNLQQCLQHILNIHLRYCLQIHYLSILTLLLHMLSFSQCEYFLHITV